MLGIERGAPLVMLDSISFSENGQPIEYYHALHRGDRSRFEVELLRSREFASKTVEFGQSFSDVPQISKDDVFKIIKSQMYSDL